MPLDSLSFTAPSRLRALLCPLGRIKRSRFSSLVSALQSSNVVRLGDVTPDPQRTMFSPQGFPDGQVVYDLSTSVDREHDYLEAFEFHRRTWAIIAIADHEESNDPETLSKHVEELKFLYPRALYHVCLVFGASPDDIPKTKNHHSEHPSFIAVPPKNDSRIHNLQTVMADITSVVLSELCSFAKTLQALPSIESPSSPDMRGPVSVRDHRMSMPAGNLEGITPLSKKRTTLTGFGSGSGPDKARNKGKGRVQAAIGQLHLLAGRVPDAMKELVEAADICKVNNDYLWHGKVLESIGVCLVILAYLKVPFQIPLIPYPTSEGSTSSKNSKPQSTATPAPLPEATGSPPKVLSLLTELHTAVVTLYAHAAAIGEPLPSISFSETVLRFAKSLVSQYLSCGSAEAALAHIVSGKPIPRLGPLTNNPPRLDISTTVMRAYPQPVEAMTVLEATRTLSGIASVFSSIGMSRRKGLVTRELLKILIPGLIQARVVGAAEVGVHPAAGLSATSGGSSPLDLGEGDVETGITELLEDLCRSYGVLPGVAPENCFLPDVPLATRSVIAEQEIRSFGWPALKIHVLRNCAALCEALPDFQGVLKFTTQLLRMADMELTKEEQMRLSTTIQRTVGAARKLGLPDVEAEYWDQFLLRDVELVENLTWRSPVPRDAEEILDAEDPRASQPVVADNTPFIFNAYTKAESVRGAAEHLLVQGEATEFRVTLQNPFEFEVEVENVTLETTGVDMAVEGASVIIAPFRTCQVSVFATPNGTGEITVTGCNIKVYGCKSRTFPIFNEGLDPRDRDVKTKRFGLHAATPRAERPRSTVFGGRTSLRPPPVLHPIPKTLSLTAIDSQPLLVALNTSLSQSALMILEGERTTFQVTFRNLAPVPVDLLQFSFSDSTTGRIQQALVEKSNSSSAERYELELMLARKKAFRWRRPNPKPDVYVPPNGTATFEIEVLGKPGLTQATISADYCHRPTSADRFFTRTVSLPITVTVNASTELARVDFLPFSTDLTLPSAFGPFTKLFSGLQTPSDYCLVLLDLRNAWPQPLSVSLKLQDYEVTEIIQAGHTSRFILPLQRLFLDTPSAPIPSLSTTTRQYIVSTTKISLDSERASREAFWFREALLARLSGRWTEIGTARAGNIELRGIRLSPRMVETIRIEDVSLALKLEPDEEPCTPFTAVSHRRFVAPTDTFLTLTATITNRLDRDINALLRIVPVLKGVGVQMGLELGRKFCINGLSQRGVGMVRKGETKSMQVGVVVMARGVWEVSGSVEEVGNGEVREEGVEGLDDEGRPVDVLRDFRGRGVWTAREVLVVEAVDEQEIETEEGL